MDAIKRFIEYAKIDTQANEESNSIPSSKKQLDLSILLVKQLKDLGLTDAYLNEYGLVYAHLKGNDNVKVGFNAHVDTATELSDENCNPQIVKNYQGQDIKLNNEYSLNLKEFPQLKKHIGHDLLVTDGNTLLGADDKAGIAIIMSALEYLKENPNVKHHNISICFTVDEEIGKGPMFFDTNMMNADYAYTIDGSSIDSIECENFNAKQAKIKIYGVAVHPGEGKNALYNAILIGNECIKMLPEKDTPFFANFDEGFFHVTKFNGGNDFCEITMILRDFSKEKLNDRVLLVKNIVSSLSNKYPKCKIELNIIDQYENMIDYVNKDKTAVNKASQIMQELSITPRLTKIRGGTDGATFSKTGLITPNLGTGSYNHHGRYEYLDINEFYMMIEIVKGLMTK